MADARDNVTIPVSVDLENLAHGLVNTLNSNGVQAFIFQLVSLRNNEQLDRELADELGTPFELPAIDFPFELLDAAARLIHPGYDQLVPVKQHDVRQAARDALDTVAAKLRAQS